MWKFSSLIGRLSSGHSACHSGSFIGWRSASHGICRAEASKSFSSLFKGRQSDGNNKRKIEIDTSSGNQKNPVAANAPRLGLWSEILFSQLKLFSVCTRDWIRPRPRDRPLARRKIIALFCVKIVHVPLHEKINVHAQLCFEFTGHTSNKWNKTAKTWKS